MIDNEEKSVPSYDMEPPANAQQLVDGFFRKQAVLSSKMRSRRQFRYTPGSPPDIKTFPGMTWKDVGRELREGFLARAGQRCDCYWCRVYQNTRRGRRENYWVSVVALAQGGDPSSLVKHLGSRRVLDHFDRRILADLLEAVFTGEIETALHPPGRPKHFAVKACASIALKFYGDWRQMNRRHNVSDWGHGDEMKDESCCVALEMHCASRTGSLTKDHPMNVIPTFEQVRELMDRSRSRR